METWKLVPSSNGLYEVSDLGGVRHALTGRSVKPYWQSRYLTFTIHDAGRRRHVRLHCVVLEAFAGTRPDGMVGAHMDGVRANCSLANLKWATPSENEGHKVAHGTDARGEKSSQARFSNVQADIIREANALGLSIPKLAVLADVNQSTIHRIIRRHRY
jgi:hypothetical protein